MKINTRWMTVLALLLFTHTFTSAQVLNRLKGKGEQKAGEAIDNLFSGKKKKTDPPANESTAPAGNGSGAGSNPVNKSGGGLISTPPDVNQNLNDAESAYKKASYGESRYAIQQAMLGVELEIGNKILKSLPETISGLKKDADADQVTSTGYGWAGLTILRKYNDNKEKELRVTIANNTVWMSAVNMYLASGAYAQQTGGEQNWKQTKVKGNRAIIEYDESSGYKLSVPVGQSSLLVYEGVNFASEKEIMAAADAIDIDGIKKLLGEN
ncbi:MAG: hypothetical protein DI538_14320 [Azospira oryzae]|nr:MAG: hypothetical protein DI538_14320 [Azospira oryzae]